MRRILFWYVFVRGTFLPWPTCVQVFKENEYMKRICVPIINDDQYEADKDFYVFLKNPSSTSSIGDPSVTRVTIIDDDGKLLPCVARRSLVPALAVPTLFLPFPIPQHNEKHFSMQNKIHCTCKCAIM